MPQNVQTLMKYSLFFVGIGLFALATAFIGQHQLAATEVVPAASLSSAREAVNDCSSLKGLARVICLADAFKATLTTAQQTTLQLPYSKADAVRWSNFPQAFSRPSRVGISFGSLNATQLKAAKALMAAVLTTGVPNEGYDELEGGLAADDYLGTTLGKTDTFGAGNFSLAFLGIPSTTGLWELQYGGHHYAFANTYKGGKIAGVTPSFRGVEPITPITVNGKTYQPMEQERQAFATLLAGLSSHEQSSAQLSASFRDILLGPGRDGEFPTTKLGLKVSDLSEVRQKLVLNAIKLYVNDLDPVTAASILARYTNELADTYLAYAGSGTMNQPSDYVRIDGPGVWIEYSAQGSRDFPGTTHPHSVWRDHLTDYGGN